MSSTISFDDGETIDLHTHDGSYQLLSRFLRKNAAPNMYFSALNDLRQMGCACQKCKGHYCYSISKK